MSAAFNARRGFFRAWILISALWVGGGSALVALDANSELRFRRAEIAHRAAAPSAVDADNPFVAIETRAAHGATALPSIDFSDLPDEAPSFLNILQSKASDAFPLLVVPPAALLVIGAALGWVIAGFRQGRVG